MRVYFGKQLTFGFDDQDSKASRELVACVDRSSSEGDHILLATLLNAAHRPVDISKDRAIHLAADLIRDDQIRLTADTKTIDKVAALSLLGQPDQWQDVFVVRAAVVEPSLLADARQAASTIFSAAAPAPSHQNELCRWIRVQLRDWINAISSLQRLAQVTHYPGKADMAAIVAAADRLLATHDPRLFLEALNNQTYPLTDLANRFALIRRFYNDCGHIWQALASAMTEFEENAAALAENPECCAEFGRLQCLFRCAQPFAVEPAILDTIAHVRSINRRIIHRQTQAAAQSAHLKIDAMLAELQEALDQAGAQSRLRNQILYPLQHLRRRLNTATSGTEVTTLLSTAYDNFDSGLDMIGHL